MDNIKKCIYMLISPSMKCYIGKTIHAKLRFRQHKNAKGQCRAIHNAIRKYVLTVNMFVFKSLYFC